MSSVISSKLMTEQRVSNMLPPAFSWLDVKFVQKVLMSWKNDETIKVIDLALKFATATGDNYLSDMIRANVKYSCNNHGYEEIEDKSLIIKITPVATKEMVEEFGIFNREINMMENILVRMNKLLSEERYRRLSPNVLYTETGENPLIVMEDLEELGYRMADRVIGLDLQHCIVTMRGLAKFHASSVAVWEKDPQVLTSCTRGFFHKDNPKQHKQLFFDGFQLLGTELLNWSELGASAHIFSDKLLKLSPVCYEKAIKCSQPKIAGFNVLNHGDCWVNNILFRYLNNGMVINNMFVDFQMSWWSSPAVDILNFFNTSLSEDVDFNRRDALLEEYLKTLTTAMRRLGCTSTAPNMEELKKSLREHEFIEVAYACVFLPHVIIPKTAAKTLEEIFELGDKYVCPGYKDLGYRRRIVRRLSDWNASGVLDI